jgi:uncharacterized repeat protein (TIGR03803 family)
MHSARTNNSPKSLWKISHAGPRFGPAKLRLTRSATLTLLAVSLLLGAAWAQKESVLYSFAGSPDGANPYYAGVVFDIKGNLYGTTVSGGATGAGTVFKVTPSGKETVLYSFAGGTDGSSPYPGVILDTKGNVYGTTNAGGAFNAGTVFKVTPSGKETVLYSFTGGADGSGPQAGLVIDKKGNLYGTTSYGGASGAGAVFKVTPSGKETVLYSFSGGTDGAYPIAGLVFDKKGSLYGTTWVGGASSGGTVFKVTPSGKETVLHSFTGNPDGAYPFSSTLVFDTKGNVYGTTNAGGINVGTVFKVTPSGKETVLYSFTGGADASGPQAGLVFDKKGNLYGTTYAGGALNAGTVFKVTPSGKETMLYSFTGGADGLGPKAGLVFDKKGNLYGTTDQGGAFGNGTVFKLVP